MTVAGPEVAPERVKKERRKLMMGNLNDPSARYVLYDVRVYVTMSGGAMDDEQDEDCWVTPFSQQLDVHY